MKRVSQIHSLLPWLGWLVACTAGLFQFLLQTSSSVMIMDLEKAFSLNSFGVSLLSSSYFYTYLICQIPAGMIIDAFKPRRTLFICQLLLAIFCYVFATADTLWVAVMARVLMGIVCAPTFVAAFYLIARTLPQKSFTLVAGFTEALAMLGGVLGESLLARSVTYFGWRHTVLFLASTALMMSILAWSVMRDEFIRDEKTELSHENKSTVLRDLFLMLKMPQAWINGLFCGLTFGVIAGFGAFWSVPFLMARYGISLNQAADASAMIFIGTAIGTPIVGWISDYFQTRRLLMILFSLAAALIFSVILYLPSISYSIMFVLIGLLGFFSAIYLLPFAVIRDITPSRMRGTAMGYINMMCILIGSPLFQPLIGACLHAHEMINLSAYQDALLIIPLSLMLAAGLAFKVREAV